MKIVTHRKTENSPLLVTVVYNGYCPEFCFDLGVAGEILDSVYDSEGSHGMGEIARLFDLETFDRVAKECFLC